ncbi:MAG: cyclic nucleotide-binding domain-containing protein [Woeseiaceae bacterium]
MKNAAKQMNRKVLKTLEPLNRLNPILIDELAAKSIVEDVPAGRIICRNGEKNSRHIYLLTGQVEIASPSDTKTKILKAKSPLTTPITQVSPYQATIKAKTNSTLLYIDSDLLELLLSDEPELTTSYEVSEISSDDADDWMLTFLQSPAFLQLPTANIQKLLTHLEEIPAKKDHVIIKQGSTDDNYYIIKSGSCNVHRQPSKDAAHILLAVLPTGSGFGEEALISNGSRNATITMREDGSLMRLKKKDFLDLLITPLISYFNFNEMETKISEGCVVLDVRSEMQSKASPIESAVNIPLSMLRLKFDSLNEDREYLLVCDDSSQSSAAAFLMIQGGFQCRVLKNGLSARQQPAHSPEKPKEIAQESAASIKAKQQAAIAKKQTEQIELQQKQIQAAREKTEQDILRHKQELAASRRRIEQKKNTSDKASFDEIEALKQKAALELKQVKDDSKKIEARQQETNDNMRKAEEMIKQSTAAAEQTRKQAEEEAALIKQSAAQAVVQEKEAILKQQKEANLALQKAEQELQKARAEQAAIEQRQKEEAEVIQQAKRKAEEAELIKQRAAEESQRAAEDAELARSEKVKQALKKAQAEQADIDKRQKAAAEAMQQAEELVKLSAYQIEQAHKKAEEEAASIRQRAVEEAEYLRAEVEAARLKMEQDSLKIKEEEKIIKSNALKMRNEADEIRKAAMNDAQLVRSEIEETRRLLSDKLMQSQEEEKRKHDEILTEAKKQADLLAKTKTQQASDEADAIRNKAQEDALRLHQELENTRKQIEDEAARVIANLQEQSKLNAVVENELDNEIEIIDLSDEINDDDDDFDVELESEAVDYTSVNIPGMESIEPINDIEAEKKARAIKEKLTQSQAIKDAQQVKSHQPEDPTILEDDDDLFTFQEPNGSVKPIHEEETEYVVSHRTRAEVGLTQISLKDEALKSVVIYQKEESDAAFESNPFLNDSAGQQPAVANSHSHNVAQFDKQAHDRSHTNVKSNTFAIAASFMLILAGAVFTLHATDTLKVEAIASLFNSGNDIVQPATAIAKKESKSIRRKVLRADTKVNVKKEITSKVDDIMQGWQNVLDEAKNPKKGNRK